MSWHRLSCLARVSPPSENREASQCMCVVTKLIDSIQTLIPLVGHEEQPEHDERGCYLDK